MYSVSITTHVHVQHYLHTPMSRILIVKKNINIEEDVCANPSTGVTGPLEIEK